MDNPLPNKLKDIIDRYIPIGDDDSICHKGICPITECQRCLDAIKIRALHIDLFNYIVQEQTNYETQIHIQQLLIRHLTEGRAVLIGIPAEDLIDPNDKKKAN